MGTITIRWYYEANVKQWEKLEQRGKLGPRSQMLLNKWRSLKSKYPGLISMEVQGNYCGVGKVDERVGHHD